MWSHAPCARLRRFIVELVALICTGSKSAFWAAGAAERRIVQWKASPVRRKGSPVQWKGGLHNITFVTSDFALQRLRLVFCSDTR